MLLDMVCRIPSECVLQLHSTRDRQAVSTFLPFSICAIYYTLSRLPQGKLGSDYIGLVRERGLGTLWCRRRPAAAEQMSTGHLHFIVRVPTVSNNRDTPLGYPGCLVRERGLEPPRHNHTHLKRACLPFQHSRECARVL